MTVHIAVVNKSPRVSAADVQTMAAACAAQLHMHAAPLWNRAQPAVSIARDDSDLMPGASPIYLFDSSDVAGAAGYHDKTPAGLPYGKVFVDDILAAGGGMTSGEFAVSATLSHEMLELFGDPACNDYADGLDGYSYAKELGDPVENDSYVLHGVAVSNFVLPAWFDDVPPAGARFDYLGKLSAPFSMTPGGYMIVMKDGVVTQRFGAMYPEWKKTGKLHPASRTARRMG